MYSLVIISGLVALSMAMPRCTMGKYEIIAKPDCKGYYICVNGKPVEMPDCPPRYVYSRMAHVCVPAGSYNDDCTPSHVPDTKPTDLDLGPLSIDEQCSLYGGLIPHPSDCQAYYNCSHKYEQVPPFFEQYLQECPYPQLFDSDQKKCEHFEQVKCGNRNEYKDGCKYRHNQCPVAHCVPCHVRLPSCEGKTDGMIAHESKRWSPYYVICYKERTVSEETCPPDQEGRTQLFHPNINMCVPLEQIPREYGGLMSDCAGQSDGMFLDDFGRCDRYTICRDGKFVDSVKCMKGETFDQLFQKCMPVEKTCGPCGSRHDC